ncbi:hypothetical protein [Dokdonella immobilis]|uniref:RiboL-PSP-HEPN domain-containing protein n=1 Tax=Dokdonella immobilis TaxID=578942 RepID=A0A1I4ZC84_9GAMM|nr:hypothetical protein [Dokdonella immobilis]SFN47807.1 hypothetical protein SAMN05216289_12460 [Dokdonella immobilis]
MPSSNRGNDLIFDILFGRSEATFPRSFREKNTPSEVMFVSTDGLVAIEEILRTALVLHQGVSALARQRALITRLLHDSKNLPEDLRRALQKDADASGKQEANAKSIVAQGFAPLNSMTLVNLCAAIEVSAENTIIAALRFTPGIVRTLTELGVTKLVDTGTSELTYSDALATFNRLKDWARNSSKHAPDGVLKMLRAVGLSINVSDSVKADIREMIYVRNCILHRRQRADGRAAVNAARLELEDGKLFSVSLEQMRRYSNAAMAFTTALATAANPLAAKSSKAQS